jgi:hypothetical protein
MPAFSILKRMANQRDELTLTALKVDGLAAASPVVARELSQAMGATWASGELSLNASLSMRWPGRCRLDLASTESTKVISVVSNNGKKRTEGVSFAPAQVALDSACALFALHSGTEGETRGAIERYLGGLKVDTRQVSLERFAGTVAFVLGSRKEGSAQLWVYKERFLPARVEYTDDSNTSWDVRFIDYTSQATGDWFPRVVEVYRGGELQLRVSVLASETRPNLDAMKF